MPSEKKRALKGRTKTSPPAAKDEDKPIGREEPSFRGSKQQGSGMNQGRGSAGSRAKE